MLRIWVILLCLAVPCFAHDTGAGATRQEGHGDWHTHVFDLDCDSYNIIYNENGTVIGRSNRADLDDNCPPPPEPTVEVETPDTPPAPEMLGMETVAPPSPVVPIAPTPDPSPTSEPSVEIETVIQRVSEPDHRSIEQRRAKDCSNWINIKAISEHKRPRRLVVSFENRGTKYLNLKDYVLNWYSGRGKLKKVINFPHIRVRYQKDKDGNHPETKVVMLAWKKQHAAYKLNCKDGERYAFFMPYVRKGVGGFSESDIFLLICKATGYEVDRYKPVAASPVKPSVRKTTLTWAALKKE